MTAVINRYGSCFVIGGIHTVKSDPIISLEIYLGFLGEPTMFTFQNGDFLMSISALSFKIIYRSIIYSKYSYVQLLKIKIIFYIVSLKITDAYPFPCERFSQKLIFLFISSSSSKIRLINRVSTPDIY